MNKNPWKIRARTGGIRRKIAKEYSQIVRINELTTTPENEPVDTASTSATSTVVHGGSVHDAEENLPEPESSLQNIQISECGDCSSSDSEYDFDLDNHLTFRKKIRTWSMENSIPHSALNKLSGIINEFKPGTLPSDARTILCTPVNVTLKNVEGGQYWHNGIAKPLKNILQDWIDIPDMISININVDGLPIFKSSTNEFWPILCNIFENPRIRPLVIGIYFGKGKPKNLNEFLEDFVNDMKILLEEGLVVERLEKTIKIKIRCFICDSPARAYIKGWCIARAGWEPAGMDGGALYCVEAPPLLQPPTAPYLLLLWVNLLDGERFGSPYAMQVPREISYEDLQKLMLKEMCQVVAERVLESAQTADIFRARIAEAHRPRDPAYLQPELPHPLFALAVEQALCSLEAPPHLRLELLWDPAHRDSIIRSPEEACDVHVSAAGAPPLTLHACLAHYTRAERLAQEDAWRCPQCQRYMPVVKTLGLWSLPDVLVIHLKRFRQQAKGRTSTKLTTMVEFPLNDFDMTPHLARRNSAAADSPSHSRSPRRRLSRTPTHVPQENMYDLYAICYHHGDDLETGHYTAACKNPYDGHWYKFDDSRVTPVDDENAYNELVNNTAYMLFYRRKKPNVTHAWSIDGQIGHWALRMPKYVRRASETLNELTEVKEEQGEDTKIESPPVELESESDVTARTQSPSPSRSVASLPDDSVTSPAPVSQAIVHNTASIVHSPTLQRPLLVEVNGNALNDDTIENENETVVTIEPYIHKDVHVNPKMTPVDTRRPRSVDYPARAGATNQDANRNYESSPLVASINGVEYHPTTEDLMLSMFQESKYIVPRHGNPMSGESHRPGEKSSAWKTRIST